MERKRERIKILFGLLPFIVLFPFIIIFFLKRESISSKSRNIRAGVVKLKRMGKGFIIKHMEEILKEIKTRVDNLNALRKYLLVYLKTPSPFQRKRILREIKSLIEKGIMVKGLEEWVKNEEEKIGSEETLWRANFGNELSKLLQNENLILKGQYPVLKSKFYTIKVSFETGTAALYWGNESELIASNIPLSPEQVYSAIKKANDLIMKRKFDPKKFFENLVTAYKRLLSEGKEKILLTEILREVTLLQQPKAFKENPVRKNFVEYPRYVFSYDLYRLRKEGLGQIRLSVATFDATTDKSTAIWVPDDEEGNGTYYSYIYIEGINGQPLSKGNNS